MANNNQNEIDIPEMIDDGVVVSLEYKLTVDGKVVDSTEGEEPLEYLHGYGNIVPGLEDELDGLRVGDAKKVTVKPEEGYGEYDEEAVANVPRSDFPAEIPVEVGVDIEMEDETGDIMDATIVWVGADEVRLDFNHPLAGKTLNFEVKVVGLRAATEEELDHGHVHSFEDWDEEE